jgi:succinate dehydrogenase/fumarate reductase flavoprotein subunit
MTKRFVRAERLSGAAGSVEFDADVLVLGGWPAGTWAAVSAAEHGARVVLADKGFRGTSGATAAAGTGVWYIDRIVGAKAESRIRAVTRSKPR